MNKSIIATLLASTLVSTSAFAVTDYATATGSEGGSYEKIGNIVNGAISQQGRKKGVEFDFEVVNTNGSGENLELFNDGYVQAAVVQADALNVDEPSVPYKAKLAVPETVWWLYNTEMGYKDIEDIEGDDSVKLVMVDDSGALYTMQNFVQEDKGYEKNYSTAILADDLYDAVDTVCDGRSGKSKVAGMLYVGNSLPKEIRNDFKGCVSVGEATDGDFNDAVDINGDKLYNNCEIAKNRYAPLSGSNSFTNEDTVCVSSMYIYRTDFEDSAVNKVVKKGVTKAMRGISK